MMVLEKDTLLPLASAATQSIYFIPKVRETGSNDTLQIITYLIVFFTGIGRAAAVQKRVLPSAEKEGKVSERLFTTTNSDNLPFRC